MPIGSAGGYTFSAADALSGQVGVAGVDGEAGGGTLDDHTVLQEDVQPLARRSRIRHRWPGRH